MHFCTAERMLLLRLLCQQSRFVLLLFFKLNTFLVLPLSLFFPSFSSTVKVFKVNVLTFNYLFWMKSEQKGCGKKEGWNDTTLLCLFYFEAKKKEQKLIFLVEHFQWGIHTANSFTQLKQKQHQYWKTENNG